MVETMDRSVDYAHDIGGRPASTPDTWLRTIGLLEPHRHTLTYSAEKNALRVHTPIVNVIERPTSSMAVVSWRDATHCRYGAQVWTLVTAREPGVCALSGQPIRHAELVFRPQRSRTPALNARAMILATAMDAALAWEEETC